MKTTKRVLSLVLCLVMLFGMLPAQVSAADEGAVMVEHDGVTSYYDTLQEAFNGFAPSNDTYGGTYVVTLLADVNGNLNKTLTYPTNQLDVTLDLNGHTITGDGTTYAVVISMGPKNNVAAGSFTLKDSSGNNSGKITGGKGGLKFEGTGCTFYFQGGTITGNHGSSKGGGILMGGTAFLNMTGGVVSNNSVTGNSSANTGLGGGILVNYGSITGGAIYGNSAIGGSGSYTGRGGGICTDVSRTAGYNTLTVANGVVYGNSAANAGDDLMVQTNGLSNTKHSLYIGTENWWIDGWNGTKQSAGATDRFNEDEPVAYTEGGFEAVNNKSIGLKYWEDPYDGPIFVITYTDGVDDEVVFEDQTYKGRTDKTTPAFKGTPERVGYAFAGWSPEVPEYPSEDMTFVAQWTPLAPYTITYTDGVEDEEIFADQVYNSYDSYATPAFEGTPTREHYIFTGWNPELADKVTESVVYVATWRLAENFTVTYTDGVEDEEIFPDQVFPVEEQQETPKYSFDGKRVGYVFSKWSPTVAATVTGDATYTAVWSTCSHSWGTPVFDEEALSNTYTCSKCGQVKVEYVAAEINGTYYETLQKALTAVQTKTGDVTIKVLADAEGAFTFKWTPLMKLNLTIDLNGHTITGTGSTAVLTVSKSKSSTAVFNLIIEDSSAEKTGTITGGKGNAGGAIALTSNIKGTDSLTINGGNFVNNTVTGNGGAVACSISAFDIIINGGVFENNTAASGGAVYAPNVTINGGTFKNNTSDNATYGGGAVYATTSLTVNDGTFTGNNAAGYGGALYSASSLTVAGGTITGNTAKYGGGIAVKGSTPKLNYTAGQIYGNTASTYGDDIVFAGTGSTAPTFNILSAADMGVEGITNWYVDGFCGLTASGEADRYDESVVIYEKPSKLTKTTIALKAASHYTVTYVDGVEDEVVFEDYAVLAAPGGKTPEFIPEREGYTFMGWEPEVAETVTADATYTATWKENAHGEINGIIIHGDNKSLSVELHNVLAYESVAVKVYAGETLLTTVSLRDTEANREALGTTLEALTVSVRTSGESSSWEATEWIPMEGIVPSKYELYIDGVLVDTYEEAVDVESWNGMEGTLHPDQLVIPNGPTDSGSNATAELITVICDSDHNHTSKTYGWGDPAANIIFPVGSEPVWDDELKAWTISVRIDSIETYYVNLRFSEEYNDIQHEVVDGNTRIDTTLVWDSEYKVWKTLTGEPFEVHVKCQTAPETPSMGYYLSRFQIKMTGTVEGEEKVWFENLHLDTLTVGEVKGNRVDGFTVDVTVALDDSYLAVWREKHATTPVYTYDPTAPATVTFTLGYTGDTTGELYDGASYWAPVGERVYTANLVAVPEGPDKYGNNVTTSLIRVICDSDPKHEPMDIKWQFQSTEIYPGAQVEWNAELGAWTIKVHIDGISVYYVWMNYEKSHNNISHTMVDEDQTFINTYLKWDEESQLWVHLDEKPIEVHVNCVTAPVAPTAEWMGRKSFQIQVKGDLDGDGIYGENGLQNNGLYELYTTTAPASVYTVGEVYGSREEGFFVDVTITLEDGDIFLTNWIEKRVPGQDYVYNWDKTQKSFTFTMKYAKDLTASLQGDGINDWVNAATGNGFGVVGEAFVYPAMPAAPEQANVTEQLVAVICDSDGERHETVHGKWYPQHCKTTSDIVWNEEVSAWTVDVRIGSLYIMYVDQLEDANFGTIHELVEDITTVYTTLKWDAENELWVGVEDIELHTTCRTAPMAPAYNQLKSYQVKVWGKVEDELLAYTTSISENGYTLSDVYGSREEGFFVDVTVTLEDGDNFLTTWVEKRAPGEDYIYNWSKTDKTVTFTLVYNGSLNGTLHGDRHAVNTNYDWVLADGNIFGVIAEAYVIPAMPEAPKQANVTEQLVAVICDSDGQRHETVYGKWYPLGHCETTGDMVWNEELETWTVDVRIGGLYIMYVDQLEDANDGTVHELVEDITTVYSTLIWDEESQLWAPAAPIELHTTCRTAPVAPAYNQLNSYQVKVWGDVKGEDKAYTTSLPEGGYTLGQVYGSREEGFFVDVTVTLEDGDIFVGNWSEKYDPCRTYAYDWDKTEKTVTFTLVYNGSLTGTLHGDRHAVNTNYDWVLNNGKTYGVISEAHVVVDENGETYHEFDSVVTEPTCTEGGYTTHTCTVCGHTVVDTETEALGHDLGEAYVVTEPTCTEVGESRQDCSRCDYFVTEEMAALGHEYESVVTEPTCTEGGFTTHTCTGCGDVYVDALTPALGHDLGEWTVTKQPTTSAEGEQVRSCQREGCTYEEKQSIPKRDKLDTPEVIKLENLQEGIRITWNKVEGAEKYRVYVKTANGWLNLGNTANTRFVYTGVQSGKSYTFTVRCVNNACNEFTSGYNTTGWTHTFVASPVVTNVESTTTGVKITWNAVTGAENYRVFVRNGNSWKTLANTGSTSFTWTGAEAGQTYIFTVRCLNAEGTAYISYCNTAGWEHTFYPTPEVTGFESTASGLKLTWSKIRGAGKYRVYAKTSNGWVKVGDTTSNSFTWTGAKAGLTYYFTVRAMNADATAFVSAYNNAGWSSTFAPIPAVTKLESETDGLKLTWTAINGAGKYRVYVKNANGGWTKIGDTTGTSFTYAAAKAGETYTFTVRAMNAEATAFVTGYNKTGWTGTFAPIPEITKLENTTSGIKLTWSKINGAGMYRVYVKNANGGWTKVVTTTATTFTYAAAKAGQTYTFTVRGINAEGDTFVTGYNTTGWTITHK